MTISPNKMKAKHQFATSSAVLAARRGRKRRDISVDRSDGVPAEKVAKLSSGDDASGVTNDECSSVGTSTPPASIGRPPVVSKKTKGFDWADYLDQEKAFAAPSKFFKEVKVLCKIQLSYRIGFFYPLVNTLTLTNLTIFLSLTLTLTLSNEALFVVYRACRVARTA